MKAALFVDALTLLAVLLLSPASIVLAFLLGVAPQDWAAIWLRYVVVFIALALVAAGLGLEISDRYWLGARKSREAELQE